MIFQMKSVFCVSFRSCPVSVGLFKDFLKLQVKFEASQVSSSAFRRESKMRCDLQTTGTEVDYSKNVQPEGIIQVNPKYVLVFVNRKFSTNRTP